MKTIKVFLMLAVLFLFAAGNASAQTKQIKEEFDGTFYNNCYDEPVIGKFTIHTLIHYNKAGNADWMKVQAQSGELVGVYSEEIFRLSYSMKEDFVDLGRTVFLTYHYNLVGDKGSHIIYSVTYEIDSYGDLTIVSEKSKCF